MDAKHNAELQTEWMKTTWETVDEVIRRGRNRSIKAKLVTDDDDDDGGGHSVVTKAIIDIFLFTCRLS
jgi:hypothetical protein